MNNMNLFDEWNALKKSLDDRDRRVFFKERDIFYASLGKNIGFEQEGKNDNFSRPVVVLRKFNNSVFLCVPLTTKQKAGIFYFNFCVKNRKNSAILSQIRLIDSKRLVKKLGMVSVDDFENMKRKIGKLLKLTDFS